MLPRCRFARLLQLLVGVWLSPLVAEATTTQFSSESSWKASAAAIAAAKSATNPRRFLGFWGRTSPVNRLSLQDDDDEDDVAESLSHFKAIGAGATSTTIDEFPRGGGASGNGYTSSSPYGGASGTIPSSSSSSTWSQYPRKVKRKVAFSSRSNGGRSSPRPATSLQQSSSSHHHTSNHHHHNNPFSSLSHWWQHTVRGGLLQNLPKIQCRVEPTTTLKLRKTFRPLGTIVTMGADYGMQTGVWQFKSSWEDALIGGKLTLAGRELQFSKTWQLTAMQDLVTRLRLRAAVDLQTYKAYCRVGFRTERLAPLNVVDGFTLRQQFSLDGQPGHIKVEVKSNFCLPEPEIEYSTETQRSLVGMGDVEINIEELNLVLDY